MSDVEIDKKESAGDRNKGHSARQPHLAVQNLDLLD